MEKAAEALKVDGDPSEISRQLQEQQVGEDFKKTYSKTGNFKKTSPKQEITFQMLPLYTPFKLVPECVQTLVFTHKKCSVSF